MWSLDWADRLSGLRRWPGALLGLAAAMALATPAAAGPEAIEVLVGASHGVLSDPQPTYETRPLRVAFNHDMKPFLRDRLNFDPWGVWQFQIEPFLAPLDQPGPNLEFGCTLGVKIGAPNGRFMPYLKGGTGPMYTTQRTKEQSTRFNFGTHVGVGLQYLVSDRAALSVECRHRHFSNADIRKPNDGVNTLAFYVGYVQYL